ncbi:heavy metal translocating P-type ATPase [Entomospira culicis]|uniref:P-type Cu(2+) transporter n=1 Tax=Entomospira culicis TaxID=2719989 RepID=A0A968GHE9_9SPIO|nr:heavy metal translocating P-type ATPase [Entomospira culicis]NIZ18862.1 copper-translocating P-type ATPase [Entomospira culicis]NIZ69077.1 copper-translocating P-type ATPase [Entomospira culicis]WDI37664.1 heavy metal translocating P-type ATPase [Entomospira culicis]WDI39292.1 heavy metal translocating P-type ATPase [Entomospira culicis]
MDKDNPSATQNATLQIQNMTCAACSSAVERRAKKIDGVEQISVNLVTGKASLYFDPTKTTLQDVMQSITKIGYPTTQAKDSLADAQISFQKQQQELLLAMTFGTLLFLLAMGSMIAPSLFRPYLNLKPWMQATIQVGLLLPVLYASLNIYRKGILGIVHRMANMDTLIAVSTITAIIYSFWLLFPASGAHHHLTEHHQIHFYFETVAVILALIKLGKYLEAKSKKRANSALAKLFELESDTALIMDDAHQVHTVPAHTIQVKQKILMRPGMRVPFDGIIVEGNLALDESHLTGESLPVDKTILDAVHAGSLNQAGSATIEVTRIGENTTLAQLRRIVEQAGLSKAPIARLADKISAIFVPIVFLIALFSAIAWWIATKDLTFALTIFMAVLVIACPCALGLATPTAIVIGVNRAATLGILIKNGEALENIGATQTIIFDKTGTLTTGNIAVIDWKLSPNSPMSEEKFLQLAVSAEQRSEHPIAKAIAGLAKSQNIATLPVETFHNEVGFGIHATIAQESILIGLGILTREDLLDRTILQQLETEAMQGFSAIPVAINGAFIGYFRLSDTIKESSKELIQSLHQHNIETILLSGDQLATTKRIAQELHIDRYYAQKIPQEKEAIVAEESLKRHTMMIGDGINDAAALHRAHTALTVHNASDVTMEVADVVLMQNDMKLVLKTILLSKKTLHIIKQNLFWAFIYNIIGIPIAAGVLYIFGGPLLDPMLGALFMAFSSVSVLTNSLRLKRIKL